MMVTPSAELSHLLAGKAQDTVSCAESNETDRASALARLKRALGEFIVDGIDTTTPLFHALLEEPDIQSGDYTIHWLEKWLEANTA